MNKLYFIISAVILFLAACEYEPSGNNFLDLTPPEDQIRIDILLNDIKPSDTIYVYRNTSVSVKINTPVDLIEGTVLLDGQNFAYLAGKESSFSMYPLQLSEGVHELSIAATFSSGTGSLAEMMGLEGYQGELKWNIRVIHDIGDYAKLGYRINEQGFLEVFWDNFFPDSIIDNYSLVSGYTQSSEIMISDVTQKSFVDYGYVCGYAYYQFRTRFKDGYSFNQYLTIETPAPKVYCEDKGLDSLRVFWDKPFANGRFNLIADNITMASEIHDTSIILPQYFGKNRKMKLEIRPRNPEYDNYSNYVSVYKNYCQGTPLGLPNWELYAYNLNDNIIYSRKYNSLVAFDATSLQEINSVTIMGNPWGFAYGGKIASAPHNSTVAAMTGEETWIYADSRFVNPVNIKPLSGSVSTRLAALTSNNRFFVVQKGTNICNVYNTLTGEEIFQFPFTYNTIYDFPDFVTVSENGQFFCASSENGIEIMEINGTSANLIYSDTRLYIGAMFVPSYTDRLLLRVGSNIEIRQIPGFNILQTLDVSEKGAVLCNIDPASMNLLYYQNDSLRVCKINNLAKTIFKIRSDETTCKMYNNKLLTFGMGGITFDIYPYLTN